MVTIQSIDVKRPNKPKTVLDRATCVPSLLGCAGHEHKKVHPLLRRELPPPRRLEALSPSEGSPAQSAMVDNNGTQCGYCTPGFVLRAVAMVQEDVPAEPDAVRQALSGNLCRCTGYEGIVQAVVEGLALLRNPAHAGAGAP